MQRPIATVLKKQLFADIPQPDVDLSGKTFLVTGGNAGLGYAYALHLARRNIATIIIASRDMEKCKTAAAQIYKDVPSFRGKVDCMRVDMASFESVRSFAQEVQTNVPRLDCVTLNAGIQASKFDKTKDGYETSLQVNVLSTGLLAVLLLPKLRASRQAQTKPHLTIVASGVHYQAAFPQQDAAKILAALNDPDNFISVAERYSTSKLLPVLFARDISALPAAEGIVVNTVNPGLAKSDLYREQRPIIQWANQKIGYEPEFATRSYVVAATTETKPGAFVSWGEESLPSKWSVSPKGYETQARLWKELQILWRGVAPEVAEILP